eukprot:111001_1
MLYFWTVTTKIIKWFNEKKNDHPTIGKYVTRFGLLVGLYMLRDVYWKCYYKYYRYPPYVSLGIPLLGCLPSFFIDPHKFSSSIVCNDGKLPITTVPLGLQNIIFINDNKTAKKLLKTPQIGMMRHLNENEFQLSSFLIINGKKWLHQRKFLADTFSVITNSSFGYLTTKELFEKDLYPNHIDKAPNGQIFVSDYCHFLSFYSIFTGIFGNQLNDIKTMNNTLYTNYMSLYQQKSAAFSLYIAYESLINIKIPQIVFDKIFGIESVHNELIRNLKLYLAQHNIINIQTRGDPNNNTNQSEWKCEWNKLNKNKSVMVNKIFLNDMNVEEITGDVYALLGAGVETTAKHLEFGLIMLCKYPKIQEKIYKELVKFKEYKPSLLENNLHFLRAFVHEILRFGVILPLGLPHKCVENVEIDGYMIYKGNTVVINHLSIHHQQKNGREFNINRWLDSDCKFSKIRKTRSLLIFGYCANSCLGKNLAMQLMYAVFALLIRKYVIYNHNIPQNISRSWGIARGIQPPIPISFKNRKTK